MSLFRLIQLHFNYCLNKRNIIIISVSFILIQAMTIFFFILYRDLNVTEASKMDIIWQNIISLEKLIFGFIIIFLLGNFCLAENDEYQYLLISKTTKIRFYLSKIITLNVIAFIYFLINYLSFIFISFLINADFILKIEYLIVYLYLYLISVYYGTITMIVIRFVNSILPIIITIILFISSNLWSNTFILSFILPSINMENITFYYFLGVIIVFIFLEMICFYIFCEYKK